MWLIVGIVDVSELFEGYVIVGWFNLIIDCYYLWYVGIFILCVYIFFRFVNLEVILWWVLDLEVDIYSFDYYGFGDDLLIEFW